MRWAGMVVLAGLVSSEARAQCSNNWDPGHYDGPIGTVFTVSGEGGLGFVENKNGPGRGRRSEGAADPWYIGLDTTLWQNLGTPGIKLLVDARYGRAFSIGRQHLNTGVWALRGAVLFGGHLEEAERPWQNVLSSETHYTGTDGSTVTNYSYCPESTAFRRSAGFGAGVQIDRLTGTPGFTLNGGRVAQTFRTKQTVLFEAYGMYGPRMGLSSTKYGAGAIVRVITDGTVIGGALEGWTTDQGGALLITAMVGGGGP